MATKKKIKNKTTGNMNRAARRGTTPMKKAIRNKKSSKKKLPLRKAAPKKRVLKTKARGKRSTSGETAASFREEVREKSEGLVASAQEGRGKGRPFGGLSGDLQGLSNIENADSESVAELLEEGNAFEADVIKGVEDAPNADKGPVRTHEVLEDDVPEEDIP